MPYRKQQFINGEIYHIVVRGIDNNLIFKDIDDYYRGIFSIYEFNNTRPVSIFQRRHEIQTQKKLLRGRASYKPTDERDTLVEILAFSFMPNHIHLALKQIKEGGIVKFMRKVGTGYGGYLNRKYGRKGYVFQNRFLAVHIKTEEQLKTVFVYIHTNAVSLIEPKWKEIGIKEPNKIIKFLEDYKWSSYPDYINKNNFPSVTERDLILKVMGGEEGCKNFIEGWIKHKVEIKESPELALE
jgi:putative transposase